jgi:hypothetical protein
MQSIGQYAMVSQDQVLKFGNRTFRVVLYGAYNAYGLIGPEKNGIAVLDEDMMRVVLDGHCQQQTGYFGPSDDQNNEFGRICGMDADEFVEFCNAHPASRDTIEIKMKARRKSFNVEKFIKIATTSVAYDDQAKREFLRMGEQVAIMLASRMGLNEDQYDVRVNKAGVAVSGEVTLHTDTHYLQIAQSTGFLEKGFLVRACKGRKDYVGSRNYFVKWTDLRDMDKVCEFVLSLS